MTSCPFCQRIERGEYEAVGEDPEVVWFKPLDPVTPGHLLFVPAAHVTDAADDPYTTAMTFLTASDWAKVNHPGSFNLITSAGAEATQTVFHLHVHLVPRTEGDGLVLPWTVQVTQAAQLSEQHPEITG
jgi:histidine triad (HIT) family protein